ncbi:hypothetical protein EST38_g5636 [Candolleomyces aberdarensis]|uniref:DUF6535 domain-containing protein n=1 Tax=Candolleomyces aberdarensis TaxID=2316362 RepID=A0A4V1Q3Y6_9AGAR|nr:hypothetical protein EST38_g5636 [Candolleomyces aberdarensis]
MYGYQRVDNPSDTDANDPVGIASIPIDQDGHAEKRGNGEENGHDEPNACDEDIDGVKLWTSIDPYLCVAEEGKMTPEDAWTLCAEFSQEANEKKDELLRQQLNQGLFLTTFFSAVITAFIIESHKLLRVDQGEITAKLLLRVHHQLDSLIRQNASDPLPPLISAEELAFRGTLYNFLAIYLLFASLAFSLGVAVLSIAHLLVLRTHPDERRATAKEFVRRMYIQREKRRERGVGSRANTLVSMFLVSLICFIIGVALYAWELSPMISIVFIVGFVARARPWASRTENKAFLGSVWMARSFPQAIRAIYAFIQSTAGVRPNLGKELLRELYLFTQAESTLHLSAYLDMDLTARCSDGLHRDIFVAYVLDRFALDSSNESGLRTTLIEHRFELLLRILNGADAYTPLDERPACSTTTPFGIGEAQVKNFTSVFFSSGDSPIENISTACRIQYCDTVWMYMKKFRVQRVSFVLGPVQTLSTTQDAILLKLLIPDISKTSPWSMNPDVMQHVYVMGERIAKAIVYVARIFEVISPKYTEAEQAKLANERIEEYKTAYPEYMDSIASLVDAIRLTTSDGSVGVPNDLLGTSDRDGWKRLLQFYVNDGIQSLEGLSGTGETGRMGGDAVIPVSFDSD